MQLSLLFLFIQVVCIPEDSFQAFALKTPITIKCCLTNSVDPIQTDPVWTV